MTCSRVTPAFTVRMTITPVVVGEMAGVWATDGWAMEVTPVRVRVRARTALWIAFIGLDPGSWRSPLLFETAVMSGMLGSTSAALLICNQDVRPLSMSDYPR